MEFKSRRQINLLSILLLIATIIHESVFVQGEKQTPCLFFFGDSLTDNGNNNNLPTFGKADYYPYGIDFPGGTTGRFSNGKIIPDFIAEFLGFEEPVPPFATVRGMEILHGVNYGSAGAGILDDTGMLQGDRISLNKQLLHHEESISIMEFLLGNATTALDHLKQCVYVVNIGSNEYLNNYFLAPIYPTSVFYTPEKFADLVIEQYAQKMKTLYEHGARKIAMFGVGILGCVPQYISNGSCDDSKTKVVEPFNNKLKSLVDTLKCDLPDANFIFINTTALSRGNNTERGIKVETISCCAIESPFGVCKQGQDPCTNRAEYSFFDNFHPSETLSRAIARRAYKAATPFDVYPFDISSLAQI